MKRDATIPRLLLGALRLPGCGAFLAPGLATKTLSLEATPQSLYLVRLFAARNVAMTAGLWTSSTARARRRWWQTGIACDALDVAAALLALRQGRRRSSALFEAGAASVATALGVAGLVGEGRGKRTRKAADGGTCKKGGETR